MKKSSLCLLSLLGFILFTSSIFAKEKITKEKVTLVDTSATDEMNSRNKYPSLKIDGFADVGFHYEKAGADADDQNNSFVLGQLDLFINSNLQEKLSVLSELVFEHDDTNALVTDLERIELCYVVSDLFKINMGRFHTPVDLWNILYHHGAWLRTPIDRPNFVEFEDGGGILPSHLIGLNITGTHNGEALKFDYNFAVGNGRGRIEDEVTTVVDHNAFKALVLMLLFSPNAIDGLTIGETTWFDRIPSNPAPSAADLANGVIARAGDMDELIQGGILQYNHKHIEWLSEFSYIYHKDRTTDVTYHNYGAYAQLGYHIKKFTPYLRFDYLKLDSADTFYAPSTADLNGYHVGLRWDPFDFAALKLEYELRDQEGSSKLNVVALNASFHF